MSVRIVRKLYKIWNNGNLQELDVILTSTYTIYSDPGDQWDGKILDLETYKKRLMYSRTAFPDLKFEIKAILQDGDQVSVRWEAVGTQSGDLAGLKASGKKLKFHGQTIYSLKNNKVQGHWQIIDRLGFIEQLRK